MVWSSIVALHGAALHYMDLGRAEPDTKRQCVVERPELHRWPACFTGGCVLHRVTSTLVFHKFFPSSTIRVTSTLVFHKILPLRAEGVRQGLYPMRLRCTLVRSISRAGRHTYTQASRCPRRRGGTHRSPVGTVLRSRVIVCHGVPTDVANAEALFSWLHESGAEPYNLKVMRFCAGPGWDPARLPRARFDMRGYADADQAVSTTGTSW